MSLRSTRSGAALPRMAVASSVTAWVSWMESITTWRWGWVALNSLTSGVAAVMVSLRAQNTTVPVALSPNPGAAVLTGLLAVPQPARLVVASTIRGARPVPGAIRRLRIAQLFSVTGVSGIQTRIGDTPRLAHR